MLKIAICDDEIEYRATLQGYLLQMLAKQIEQVEILLFASGEELLKDYPRNLDILLLDIMMEETNGMEIAKKIRRKDQEVQIVFITNMPQYALEGYKVHAFGYLLKPLTYTSFQLELYELIQRIFMEKSCGITLKNGNEITFLPYRHIIYIETEGRKLTIHTKEESLPYSSTMSKTENALEPYGFIRSHHSYLVNMRYVKSLTPGELLLKDGSHIPLSRNKRLACIQSLTRYFGGKL